MPIMTFLLPCVVYQAVRSDGEASLGSSPCIRDAAGNIVCRFYTEGRSGCVADDGAFLKAEALADTINIHPEVVQALADARRYIGLVRIDDIVGDDTILPLIREIDALLLRVA
jgi:hypothetical protein